MAEPLRHRQTKEAATDMFYLKPPRHISTLPFAPILACPRHVRLGGDLGNAGCPVLQNDGKLPDGQISKNLSSPADKNIPLNPSGKSPLQVCPVPPEKGRIASRHERAVGCDGRDSVGRAMGSQGGSSRERSAGGRTNDAAAPLRRNSPGGTRRGKIFGGDGRGRRSRVVLAPRCWRQVLRRCIRPNRVVGCIVNPKGDGGKQAGHRGER